MDCEHAERCAGCPLIAESYAEQLVRKSRRLERAAERWLDAPLCAEPIAGSDQREDHRPRAKWVIAPGPRLGLYARGSHDVIDIPHCKVVTPSLRALGNVLRDLAKNRPDLRALWPHGAGSGALLAVDLRAADGGSGEAVLVTLVVADEAAVSAAELQAAAEVLLSNELVSGVFASKRSARGPTVLGRAPELIAGKRELPDRIGDVEHLAIAGGFVQAHRTQAARLHRWIGDWLAERLGGLDGAHVVELFGGSGAIGLALAARGASVTLIESFAPAAHAAGRAAKRARLPLDAVAGDASAALPALGKAIDAIVVDPPRRGLAAPLRASIARARPRAIVYVACEPETLGRDLAAFHQHGYSVRRARALDLMPHTDEVETVVLLTAGSVPPPRVLHEDAELLAVDKPPHLPTTPQGEHDDSLLQRVQRLSGWRDAAPVHRLDATTSGVCLFARKPEHVARLALGLKDGFKRYLALARGVTSTKGVVNRALVDGGRERAARTRYRRLEVVGGHSLLEVRPDHGRRHQIRRHLASLGHPVVGDVRHGHAPTNHHFAEKYHLDRPFLHAAHVELSLPGGGTLVLEAAPARDLRWVLEQLSAAEGSAAGRKDR